MKKPDPTKDVLRLAHRVRYTPGGKEIDPKVAVKRKLRQLVREAVAMALESDEEYGDANKIKLAKIIAKELIP